MKTNEQITITEATGSAGSLYLCYSGQVNPQGVYIELDGHAVSIGVDGEIGNAVPCSVWHGTVRRYGFPVVPTVRAANEAVEELRPLLQRVADGLQVVWDGNNNVGRLSDDAAAAEGEILDALRDWGGDGVSAYSAWDRRRRRVAIPASAPAGGLVPGREEHPMPYTCALCHQPMPDGRMWHDDCLRRASNRTKAVLQMVPRYRPPQAASEEMSAELRAWYTEHYAKMQGDALLRAINLAEEPAPLTPSQWRRACCLLAGELVGDDDADGLLALRSAGLWAQMRLEIGYMREALDGR